MKSRFVKGPLTLALTCNLLSCGSNSDVGATVSAWIEAFPSDLAISSLTSSGSSALKTHALAPNSIDSEATFEEKKEVIDAVLSAEDTNSCGVALPPISSLNQNASCYGPGISYSNHPDGSPTSGTLPGGDLGLWDETEGASEACVAAQMNSLIAAASSYVDASMGLSASMNCVLKNSGVALPGSGESASVSDTLNESMSSVNTGMTVKSASVTQVDDSTFLYSINVTLDSGEMLVYLKHQASNDENTQYLGRIWGYHQQANKNAFSVVYQKETRLNLRMVAGQWDADTSDSVIFDSVGDIKMDSAWNGNMNHALFDVDTDNGSGNISYAWQAGNGDDSTRVFNAYVDVDGSSESGCGFFGFGDSFDGDYANNTNSISKFVCNWAGPSNSHTGVTGKAQKQCISKSSEGIFEATSSLIDYAPENSCDATGAFSYTLPSHLGAVTTSNELVTLSGDSNYTDDYSAPTAPTLPTDF